MIKETTIDKYQLIFDEIESEGLSISEYCQEKGLSKQTIYNLMVEANKDCDAYQGKVQKLINTYRRITGESTEAIDTNDVAEVSYIRDENDMIKAYQYRIYRKNKAPLFGTLSLEEMTVIYRLYSYYGDNLPAKAVSRHFPDLSVMDLKRILSAFNIYKVSSPFPPHYYEIYSEEELRTLQTQERENSFLRKAEEDRIKDNERLLRKYAQENIDLKRQIKSKKSFLESCNIEDLNTYIPSIEKKENTLIITLSDLHIGAYNEKYGFVELPEYNTNEIMRRLSRVIDFVASSGCKQLIVCNLGDSVDSYNKETSRGGHTLPGSVNDKDMSKAYLSVMTWFFKSLSKLNIEIAYFCVGESNHDGNWGWLNNIALAQKLDAMNIPSYISDYPIDSFDVGNLSIVYLHGKDIKSQFKGFPLTLNDKTINWFNDWMLTSGKELKQNRVVIKGDLHQFAITECNTFKYVSMPSLYGSSRYIVSNFGLTPWGIGYIKYNSDSDISFGTIHD